DTFALDVGGQFAIGGGEWTVAGIVENPSDLTQDFALVPPMDPAAETVTLLADASADEVQAFRLPSGSGGVEVGERSQNVNVVTAVAVLVISVVALMLV